MVQQSACKLPASQEHCRRALTEQCEPRMRLNLGKRTERLSSLFLPLSSPVPTDCGRSDCSLSGRCRKKGNRKKGEEKPQQAVCPALDAHLNSLNIWKLIFLWLVAQSLSVTKMTRVLPALRTFTHHSHPRSENLWWLLGQVFPATHPLIRDTVLRRLERWNQDDSEGPGKPW